MADALVNADRREHYIGEKQKLLRNGYGTYVYENHFFRYEGEWMKGKKHGHGKLIMKDGTYYEGQFINGEINGCGFKYFAFSQSKYTGQFLNGEINGHGCMIYKNGGVYDGQWYRNKRQGFGVLSTRKNEEDIYHPGVLEGEEIQPYDDGDRYEGNWVLDKKQGYGELKCADGTSYRGQFKNDLFQGEGTLSHSSGMYYSGLWLNGFPANMATKIVLLSEESPLILCQGQSFTIRVECRNDENQLVPDTGRELQVIAGYKYWEPKEGSALFDIIEDVEDKPITTPFYDVVLYPLTDQLLEAKTSPDAQDEVDTKSVRSGKYQEEDYSEIAVQPKESLQSTQESDDGMLAGLSESASLLDYSHFQIKMGASKEATLEEVTHLLPPVQSKPTASGMCEWLNLQLAPPPPMYRPFVIMEEETRMKKRSRHSVLRDNLGEENGLVDEEEDDEEDEDKAFLEMEEVLGEKLDKEEEEGEVIKNEADDEIEGITEGRKSTLTTSGQQSKQSLKSDKLKMSEEKFARPGEYILMVQDITTPPFMGRRLEPAYLVIQLKELEKTTFKKTSLQGIDEDEVESDYEDKSDYNENSRLS